MQFARSSIAYKPRLFGRGPARVADEPLGRGASLSGDVKLFAATFVAGFIFVSVLIG